MTRLPEAFQNFEYQFQYYLPFQWCKKKHLSGLSNKVKKIEKEIACNLIEIACNLIEISGLRSQKTSDSVTRISKLCVLVQILATISLIKLECTVNGALLQILTLVANVALLSNTFTTRGGHACSKFG